MGIVRHVVIAFAQEEAARATLLRVRLRALADALGSLAVTLFALVLVLGFQFVRLRTRFGRSDRS
jgi:hypothetical protein